MCDRETIKCFTLLSVGESGSYCKVNFNEMYHFEHVFADTPGVHELPKIRNDPGGTPYIRMIGTVVVFLGVVIANFK